MMMELCDELLTSFCKTVMMELDEQKQELVLHGKIMYSQFRQRISDADLPSIVNFISRHKEIVGLDLSYNNVSDAGMWTLTDFLKDNETLLHVNVMCNDISVRGIQQAFSRLGGEKAAALRSLRVNGNKFGPEGGKLLAKFLESNSYLKHLDVAETDQDETSVVYFTTVLRYQQVLEVLDISRPLGHPMHTLDSAHLAYTLGQMLRFNQCLRELRLQKYGFSDHDVELMVLGLMYNNTLQLLDLSCNNIGDYGTEYLGKYLRQGPALQGLVLNHNIITDAGARCLSFSIPYSKLRFLDVAYNKLTDAGIMDILYTIERRPQYPIQSLFMWGNSITHTSCQVIKRMLSSDVLNEDMLDVRIYEVDSKCSVAFNNVDRYRHVYYRVSGEQSVNYNNGCSSSIQAPIVGNQQNKDFIFQ